MFSCYRGAGRLLRVGKAPQFKRGEAVGPAPAAGAAGLPLCRALWHSGAVVPDLCVIIVNGREKEGGRTGRTEPKGGERANLGCLVWRDYDTQPCSLDISGLAHEH